MFVSNIDPSVREAAKQLTLKGYNPKQIAARLPVKEQTVYKWRARHKWLVNGHKHVTDVLVKAVEKPLPSQSEAARLALADVLSRYLASLSAEEFSSKDLRNSKGTQGLAAVHKSLCESASLLFNWRETNTSESLIVMGDMRGALDVTCDSHHDATPASTHNQCTECQAPPVDTQSHPQDPQGGVAAIGQ